MGDLEFIETPVAYLASSELGIGELIDCSQKFSKGRNFILLMKKDEKLIKRLLPAYVNACVRYVEGETRARSLAMEMLLFVSGTMRTDKAIKESGASDNSGFILFWSNKSILKDFVRKAKIKLGKEYKLELDLDVSGKVASAGMAED